MFRDWPRETSHARARQFRRRMPNVMVVGALAAAAEVALVDREKSSRMSVTSSNVSLDQFRPHGGVTIPMRRTHRLLRGRALDVLPLIPTLLAACGDASTEPGPPATVAGIFSGTVAFSVASCSPTFPSGFDRNGYTEHRVLDLTQSAASLSGMDHLYTDLQVSGSVSGPRIALTEHLEWSDAAGSVKVDIDYDLRLASSGKLTGTGTSRAIGTEGPTRTQITCIRTATLDLQRTGPIVDVTATPCLQESMLKSQSASSSAFIIWRNDTDSDLRVHWRDYEGRRVYHGVLAAHGRGSTITFETHPFVLTDLADNCVGVYLPRAGGPTRVTVR